MAKFDTAVLMSKRGLRDLEIEKIQFDRSYQRELRPGHKKIVASFKEEALGVPLVGERDDGSLWGVDGQQRLKALLILGRKKCRCDVFRSKGPEHEAQIFAIVNGNRTKLLTRELFQSRLTAGDTHCWEIKNAIESEGYFLSLGTHSKGGKSEKDCLLLSCLGALYRIMVLQGKEPIIFALQCIKASWPGDVQGVRDAIIKGLVAFYNSRKGDIDQDRLIDRLKTVTPAKVIYAATMGVENMETGACVAIERIYRKRYGASKNNTK